MPNPGQTLRLHGSAQTSVGQVRENNEDHIHLRTGDGFMLALVADGMGGAAAGEEASRIAVEIIDTDLAPGSPRDRAQEVGSMSEDMLKFRLQHAIQKANLSIMRRAIEEPDMRGMGTTVTLALLRGGSVTVAHVGDSRAYLVSAYDRAIQQITSDHSFVEALLAAGHITAEQAEEHPMRNVLYRALGQAEDMDVDLYHAHLRHGDRLVLCSDGLTRHVKAHEIARIVLNAAAPADAGSQLINLANERGGEDNVSVIVIQAEGDPPAAGAGAGQAQFLPEEPGSGDSDTVRMPDLSAYDSASAPDAGPLSDSPPRPSLTLCHKMSAERLSDTGAEADAATPDHAPAARPPQPGRPRGRAPAPRLPAAPASGEGEGQDTRVPDQ